MTRSTPGASVRVLFLLALAGLCHEGAFARARRKGVADEASGHGGRSRSLRKHGQPSALGREAGSGDSRRGALSLLESLDIVTVPQLAPNPTVGTRKSVQPTSDRLASVNSGQAATLAPQVASLGLEEPGSQVDAVASSAVDAVASSGVDVATSADGPEKTLLIWPGTRKPGRPVAYHNGLVLIGEIHLYLLFYGNWSAYQNRDVAVIINFIQSISDASADSLGPTVHKWWNLMLQYTSGNGSSVAAQVTLANAIMLSGQYSKSLDDGTGPTKQDDTFGLLSAAIEAGSFPLDAQGLYVLLTSPDIAVGPAGKGFCSDYCSSHGWNSVRGQGVPFIFVGDSSQQCPRSCGSELARANGYPGAESMITSLAHEIAEAAANPDTGTYKGWWSTDLTGSVNEPADLCNRIYRDDTNNFLFSDAKGSYMFNMYGLNNYKYLVQGLPDVSKQQCAIQGEVPSKRVKA